MPGGRGRARGSRSARQSVRTRVACAARSDVTPALELPADPRLADVQGAGFGVARTRAADLGRRRHVPSITSRKVAAVKAVVYKGPFQVAVEEVPDPKIEHPNDALVRITSTAICG